MMILGLGLCCYMTCRERRRGKSGFSLLPQKASFLDDDDKETELFRTPIRGMYKYRLVVACQEYVVFVTLCHKLHSLQKYILVRQFVIMW